MTAGWKTVPLGEVIQQRKEFIEIDDIQTYKRARVQLHAKGIVLRDIVEGSLVKTKRQQVSRAGEFLVAEIDAKVGGFGMVPDELDGAIVSSHYFLFQIDQTKLERRFLDFYIRTPAFRDQVEAQGSTNYAAIRPAHVLGYQIPLPPLVEQRRIVTRIEAHAAQIEEARKLRKQVFKEAEALHLAYLHGAFTNATGDWHGMPMEEAIEITARQVDPTLPDYAQYPHISGENMESSTCRLLPWRTAEADGVKSGNYLFRPGTILYSKIRPYLRKAVFVDFEGVCSADVYPIEVKSKDLDPRYVMWFLVAEPFTEYANKVSGRTRMPKLNRKQLFAYPFSYPSISKQHRIVAELDTLQKEVAALKRLQSETAAELDALLPAILDRAFKGEL